MTDTADIGSSGDPLAESATRPSADARADSRHRGDTRRRIQIVAVELFTEHGYDGTSLREIAERLDVTKAALYYHFKSKEDIVASLVEDHFGRIDDLIAWGREQPPTSLTRREVLNRYVRILEDGDRVFRMLQQNQAAVHAMASAKSRGELFRERMHALNDLITEPGADQRQRVRAAMILGGITSGWMFFADRVADQHELGELVRSIADEFLAPGGGQSAGAGR
ncbi:MAG: TetR/AcrR family transcriptional regulator [Streptosporangiaceae bacterium]